MDGNAVRHGSLGPLEVDARGRREEGGGRKGGVGCRSVSRMTALPSPLRSLAESCTHQKSDGWMNGQKGGVTRPGLLLLD